MKRYEHPYWAGYSASKNGSVYGKRGRVLSPIIHHTGYGVITVRKDGVQRQLRIHRFVWECIFGEIPEGLVINHKDGNKINNSIDNLEVVTNRENTIHCWTELGREVKTFGEQSASSKLTEVQAKEVIAMCEEGFSNKVIGDKYGLHPNYISLIRHNKRWKHLSRNKKDQ